MERLNTLTRHPAFAGEVALAEAGPEFRRRYAAPPAS